MDAIHRHDIAVVSLGSGSRGNATYIGDGTHGVLVDCGISTRQIFQRLASIGMSDARIDAVLITHEHSDHVGSAAILERHLLKTQGQAVPFLMTAGTARGLTPKVRPSNVELVSAGEPLQRFGWTLEPHAVPHDTHDPVAWTIETRGVRAGVMTDLGHAPRQVHHLIASLDLAVLEFNHDQEMLMEGSYPWPLKQRIRGRHGHLSNRQGAELLRSALDGRLRSVILAHLSEENNTPAHAHRAASVVLHEAGRKDVELLVANQREPRGPIAASTPHVQRVSPHPHEDPPRGPTRPESREPRTRQGQLFEALGLPTNKRGSDLR